MSFMEKLFGNFSDKELKRIKPIANKVLELEPEMQKLTDEELQAKTPYLKEKLKNGASLDDILPEAFAVCREADWRVLGLKPYPVQIIGGIVLHRSCIAEMQTGEGKTLVATMPVYLNALTGEGVHVVTVNDYLAKRDSEWMGKVYRFLGLTVGLVIHDVQPQDRRKAYLADVTYGTNNEFGFDYLRDNMVVYKASMVQRGHAYAIVDEVDSILIDEARTPLIISGKGEDSSAMYKRADDFAKTLKKSVIVELDDKVEADEQVDGDYVVDEKHKTCTLTESGVKKAEAWFNVENLADADNMTLRHGLQIVSIPTNKPRARKDLPDSVYKTINGKYNAVIEQVAECHAKGQPVLVGTVSVEKSEALSKLLKKRGIEHNVLNAKQHEREAEIVAQAGKQGAVTIATNMAGRGTDIMLGGNVTYMAKATLRKELTRQMNADLEVLKDEYEHAKARAKAQGLPIPPAPDTAYEAKVEMLMTECDGHADTQDADILAARKRFDELVAEYEPEVKREAEAVREAGGLFIIGTERHESRRIDNQLRGRAGRQGDPGASRFFLSLEDDLMRIFGGERVQGLMDTLGLDEDMPIENKLITNTIESAQKKLEASNFAIRKQVLQYDDVMNQQREIIYKQRQMVLDGEDISDKLHEMMKQSIDETCESFLSGETADDWDFAALRRHYLNWLCLPTDFNYTAEQLNDLKREDVAKVLYERGMSILESKEQKYGAPMMRELERICLLRNVDSKWMDAKPTGEGAPAQAGAKGATPVRVTKIGRNDPCPCGSGLKWKKCTCKEYHPDL